MTHSEYSLILENIPTSLVSRLIPRYAEPHRRYHTWSHIGACFAARDRISKDRSRVIDLALLFHDAIYQPLASDNEQRSAELLLAEGQLAHVDGSILKLAASYVLATKHDGCAETLEACIVVDADLSILGADATVFDEYELAVRREYEVVDDATFCAGRAKILHGLLDRDRIFQTTEGRELWETAARKNLERSLASLQGHAS